MRNYFFLFIFILPAQVISDTIIPVAHAHNDYAKKDALYGALEYGFTSIEIDIFAHKGKLKIAHVPLFLGLRKTLDEKYLAPLAEVLATRKWIYEDYEEPLVLMLDFKTSSEKTLPLLMESIKPYQDLFTYYENDSVIKRPLQLVISGAGFSYEQVEDETQIFVFRDGGVHACENNFPSKLVARGSTHYKSIFSWRGEGEIPKDELEKLRKIIAEADKCDKKIRFWAMPQNENVWRTLLNEGVDWINIDNKKKFAEFYKNEIAAN